MKYLIDFKLFFFDCINIENKNLKFTYKTNEQGFNKINKSFHEKLKEICNSKNFHTTLSKRKNDHIIDNRETKEKIATIFQEQKYPKKWIDEHIWNTIIYQHEFHSKKQRLFFIFEKNISTKENPEEEQIYIIRPLFLDLNHALNPNTKRDNVRYEKCFACHEQNCNK